MDAVTDIVTLYVYNPITMGVLSAVVVLIAFVGIKLVRA
jgi:hypothetical protein